MLRGEGRAFSAGGDLNFLRARHADTADSNIETMLAFYNRFLCVRRIPVPVIAAVNGPAIGAGLCLALACDMRIAASSAKLGVTFTKLGLHPGMGATHFLPRLVGPAQAARLLYSGDIVSGEEAARIGMVAEALQATATATGTGEQGGAKAKAEAESEMAVRRAIEIAEGIAAAGPVAVRETVASLRGAHDAQLGDSLLREAQAQAVCYAHPDLGEGVEAVAAKRAPVFEGF